MLKGGVISASSSSPALLPGFPANDLVQWMSSTPTRLVWPRLLVLAPSWCVRASLGDGEGADGSDRRPSSAFLLISAAMEESLA